MCLSGAKVADISVGKVNNTKEEEKQNVLLAPLLWDGLWNLVFYCKPEQWHRERERLQPRRKLIAQTVTRCTQLSRNLRLLLIGIFTASSRSGLREEEVNEGDGLRVQSPLLSASLCLCPSSSLSQTRDLSCRSSPSGRCSSSRLWDESTQCTAVISSGILHLPIFNFITQTNTHTHLDPALCHISSGSCVFQVCVHALPRL